MSGFKKMLEINFIAEAFFELTFPGEEYAQLLNLNHNEKFLSLSNADYYILILQQGSPEGIAAAKEHLSRIYNRKKKIVQMEKFSLASVGVITPANICQKAIENGFPSQNLFLKLLIELK